MKTDFSKTELFKYILEKEKLTENHIKFIYNEICNVSWRAKTLKSAGFEWFNLSPTLLQDLIDEYNACNIDISTGKILERENKEDDKESKRIFGE